MDPPEPAPAAPQSGFGISRFGLMLLGLAFAYVLSLGPVAGYYKGKPVPAAVRTFYAPLSYAHNQSAPARRILEWYLALWGG